MIRRSLHADEVAAEIPIRAISNCNIARLGGVFRYSIHGAQCRLPDKPEHIARRSALGIVIDNGIDDSRAFVALSEKIDLSFCPTGAGQCYVLLTPRPLSGWRLSRGQ